MTAEVLAIVPWVLERWLPKITIEPHPELPTPCVVWHGGKSPDGYGLLRINGKMTYLHRHAWHQANGEPLGPERDGHHLCYNRPCFSPHHIAATTRDENRGATQFKANCPVPAEELVALYDLYAYEMARRGYVVGVAGLAHHGQS